MPNSESFLAPWSGSGQSPEFWSFLVTLVQLYLPKVSNVHIPTSRSTLHSTLLHTIISSRSWQGSPPCFASWKTFLVLILTPPPQVLLHLPQGNHIPILQSTWHSDTVQASKFEEFPGHCFLPPIAGLLHARARTLDPCLQEVEHGDQWPHSCHSAFTTSPG